MSSIIIAESISKAYKIRHEHRERYTTLRDTLAQGMRKKLQKAFSYWKSGSADGKQCTMSGQENFWALKDVSFEVKPGDRIGIIGRNGAGKSTLLKILSRITRPTGGKVTLDGRVASLLEVGTGFHPELTGRENVFLNGAIMGMKRSEIHAKFDEIVAFAEVEKFIDTPVKRYSTGMYVRLAFSVAAHLEHEILLVDEVLAVGDAQFQKKSLGKMGEVSREGGRTILLVSHNMTVVQRLCEKALWLDNGVVLRNGAACEVVAEYLKKGIGYSSSMEWNDRAFAPGNDVAGLKAIRLLTTQNHPVEICTIDEPLIIEVEYLVYTMDAILNLSISVFNQEDVYILASPSMSDGNWFQKKHPTGLFKSRCIIPGNFLNQGRYSFTVLLVKNGSQIIGQADRIVSIDVIDSGAKRGDYLGFWGGVVRPELSWSTSFIDGPREEIL